MSSLSPVRGVITLNSLSCPQRTVEGVLRGVDHDSDVTFPGDNVPGLRISNPFESVKACVQHRRRRVGVIETRSLVNGVHQVGAIQMLAVMMAIFKGRRDH